MNALIFVLILAFVPGSTEASAASVLLFLVIVEWLADRFAGWLSRHWVAHLVRPPNDLGKVTLMGMSQLPPVRPNQTPSSAASATSALHGPGVALQVETTTR